MLKKLKNNKSIIKRFIFCKNKLKRRKSFTNHFLLKKNFKNKSSFTNLIYKKNIKWE